jgi:hypothetical protein
VKTIGQIPRRAISLALLLIFLLSLFSSARAHPGPSESSQDFVWVLVKTEVNPDQAETHFIGGEGTGDWYPEERYKGSELKYDPKETVMTVSERRVDGGPPPLTDLSYTVNFERPFQILHPGETIKLKGTFSGGGEVNGIVGPTARFWYTINKGDASPGHPVTFAPWKDGGDSSDQEKSFSYRLTIPKSSYVEEFTITAQVWNASPCRVEWTYQRQESWTWSKQRYTTEKCHEYQQKTEQQFNMKAPYVGIAIAAMGDVRVRSCEGDVSEVTKGRLIAFGDCVQTGPDGRARIQMGDRDEERNAGPSVINIAKNSEMCFSEFLFMRDKDETVYDLFKGTIRKFFRGWRGDSQVSVRTGVTVCGMRGTDFAVTYDPESQISETFVQEGIVDVTNLETGEMKTVNASQMLITAGNTTSAVEPFGPDQWDQFVESYGIAESSTDPEYYVEKIEEDDLPAEGVNESDQTISEGKEIFNQGWPFVAIGCLSCGGLLVAVVVVGVILYSQKKRKDKQKPETG